MRVEDQVRSIEAHAYDRYVRGVSVEPIDEFEAVRFLDDYYSQPPHRQDPSCGYVGILWFEVSFQVKEDQRLCLERAQEWLLRARELSGSEWEAVEERLTDLETMLAE